MKTSLLPLVVVSLGLLVNGCGQADKAAAPASGRSNGLPAGEFPPARPTSFAEVTGQLDPGGNVYGYLATDQWLAGLATNVASVREFALGLPDVSTKDRENITRVFDILNDVVVQTGLEDLTGVGLSGVQIGPDLFRTKAIFHHQRGQGEGLLWNVMGKQAHDLTGLDLLPATTALAVFGDLDVKAVWQAIQDGVKKSEVPELVTGLTQWEAEFEKGTKLAWADVLASLGGEVGVVFTLDQAHMIDVPFVEGVQLPEPGFLFAVKVKNDLLYDRISSELKKNSMAQLTDEKDLKMCAMPIPLPLPVTLEITVARAGDYLFFATASKHVRNAIAVRDGKQPGMRKSPEFAELLKHLPAQGNHFFYADKRFSTTLIGLQQQLLESGMVPAPQAELLRKLFLKQKPTYGLAIGSRTPTGWQFVSVGNQDSSKAVVVAAAAFPAGLLAAIAVPNFVKARETAQQNACINNLRMIANAKDQWALENNKPANATPLNRDLTQYFPNNIMPTCPKGGGYTVGKLSVAPKCSQSGHVLPQ
ncbi:MAG: hypothetical protein QM813_20270 [Verrucomicrobiota bacterium]